MDASVKRFFIFIGFCFLLLIVGTIITVRIATKKPLEIIDHEYYEKGLNYIKSIQQSEKK